MVQRKALLANPKHQYRVSQCGEYDCSANNKKNGDYYEHPSLSHFTDELWLLGKWWKENFSCNPNHQYCVSYYGEHDCHAYIKRNGDYYGYLTLSHFTDELWL